jgi:hypothetical protein
MHSLVLDVVAPIDPSAGIDGALSAITGAINSNQVAIMAVAGGLLAVGVVWKFARKFTKA